MASRLKARGYDFYSIDDPEWKMFRLMTAFDTRPEDVDALLAALRHQGPVRVNVP